MALKCKSPAPTGWVVVVGAAYYTHTQHLITVIAITPMATVQECTAGRSNRVLRRTCSMRGRDSMSHYHCCAACCISCLAVDGRANDRTEQHDGWREGSFLCSMSTLTCNKHMLLRLDRSSCCKRFVYACSCTLFVGECCLYLVSQIPPWLCNAKELCEQNASNSQHGPSAENRFEVERRC